MINHPLQDIQDAYWKYLLIQGERPKSVYAFMDSLEREESEFYKSFASMDALESAYWLTTVEDTITVLVEDADYAAYPADQKLLAFFYTYVAHIQKHRSRVVGYFPKLCSGHQDRIKQMKHRFCSYANEIVAEGVQQGIFADRKKLLEYYEHFIFMHFLAIIQFYIKDTSSDFQDTDAFIEKSSQLAFQSAASGVLESGFDFVRFMVGKDDRLQGLTKMMSKFIPE